MTSILFQLSLLLLLAPLAQSLQLRTKIYPFHVERSSRSSVALWGSGVVSHPVVVPELLRRCRSALRNADATMWVFSCCSLLASLRPRAADLLLNDAVKAAAWQLLLPASLCLSIASTTPVAGSQRRVRPAVLVAFIFGTMGSVIGGLCSFAAFQLLLLPYCGASATLPFVVCTSALTASYIGGTANFFETASNLRGETCQSGAEMAVQSAVTRVAAADIGVMIVYFHILGTIRRAATAAMEPSASSAVLNSSRSDAVSRTEIRRSTVLLDCRFAALTALLMIAAAAVTMMCAALQNRCLHGLPGVSVLLVTMVGTISAQLLPRIPRYKDLFLPQAAAMGAEVLLVIFYAVLGLQSPWQDILRLGAPYVLLFGTMLSCHFGALFAAKELWNRLTRKWTELYIDLDSALIASNACVGGAATAASMAISFRDHQSTDGSRAADMALSASAAGIVGYIIGTPLGLMVARRLLRCYI